MALRPGLEFRYIAPSRRADYRVTSDATDDYNCFAWAADLADAWVWPGPEPYHWWPHHLPRDGSLAVIVTFFEELGYEAVGLLDDFAEHDEHIAIFGDAQGPTHAERQLPNGAWTSKLGISEDIEHDDLAVLSGYGEVIAMLRRPQRESGVED